MVARKKSVSVGQAPKIVQHHYEQRTYQIDPDRRKVYRRFVEIETSKASMIFADWRSQNA